MCLYMRRYIRTDRRTGGRTDWHTDRQTDTDTEGGGRVSVSMYECTHTSVRAGVRARVTIYIIYLSIPSQTPSTRDRPSYDRRTDSPSRLAYCVTPNRLVSENDGPRFTYTDELAYTGACMHTYIHTHIHTYIHTHRYPCMFA